MTKQYKAAGVFPTRAKTETALRELIKKHGFPSEQISVVARQKEHSDLNDLDYEGIKQSELTSEGAKTGGFAGGTLGGLTGLLIGLGSIAIPGIGPIMLAGAATTAIATTVAGSAIGAATGTLVGGLIGLGFPKEKARAYRVKVAEGGHLVIVEGTIDEVQLAETILRQHDVEEWEVYEAFENDSRQTAKTDEKHLSNDTSSESSEIVSCEAVPSRIETPSKEPFPATATVIEKPIQSHHLRMMGTFPRLPKAKTAVIELIESGYPIDYVTLFINDDDRHDWFPNLRVRDTLDYSFNRLAEERRVFFQDCFDCGQYILMIDGTDAQIRDVELALRTKRILGFYVFDPYDNGNSVVKDNYISFPDSRPLIEIIDRRL